MVNAFKSQPVNPGDRISATCRADFIKGSTHIRWWREDHQGNGQYMDNCNGINDCGIDDCKTDDTKKENLDKTFSTTSTLTICASKASHLTYKCTLEGDYGQILQKTTNIKLRSEYYRPQQ